ncbi:hypothetical protein F5148DRAFT_1148043 [Russula earlei]|uniref:Uncharacterized protein n=1 Tax=Russula earlei TaxID=71964 RepID=A0ACC0UG00_9AGAM|nr:hypothetical protein F5148DRAFT_1148043 [Russula earlei]
MRPKQIGKDCTSGLRTVEERRSLEIPLVLIGELLYTVGILEMDIIGIGQGWHALERSWTYVVIAVEEHEQHADSGGSRRRRDLASVSGKRSPQPSCTRVMLSLFVVAMQWCKVNIRRRLVDVHVCVRRDVRKTLSDKTLSSGLGYVFGARGTSAEDGRGRHELGLAEHDVRMKQRVGACNAEIVTKGVILEIVNFVLERCDDEFELRCDVTVARMSIYDSIWRVEGEMFPRKRSLLGFE